MHKLLLFLKRRPGMSLAEFRAYYEDQHVPLCMTYMGAAERYVRRYLEPAGDGAEPEFDVITELWFRDRVTVDQILAVLAADAMPKDVIADELNLFDRAKSRAFAVTECETPLG